LAIEGDLLTRFHEADQNGNTNHANQTAEDSTSQKMPVYLSIFALAQ
jgi:hypothetical protein